MESAHDLEHQAGYQPTGNRQLPGRQRNRHQPLSQIDRERELMARPDAMEQRFEHVTPDQCADNGWLLERLKRNKRLLGRLERDREMMALVERLE